MEQVYAKIIEVHHPEAEYVFLRFEGLRPIKGIPGQFVMVRGEWGVDPILPRAFSLVEAGDKAAILVRIVGKGTKRLGEMRPGDALSVLGPKGRPFTHPKKDEQPILVAGGVGVAPLVFAAQSLSRLGFESTFIYGGRTAQHLPLREEIEKSNHLILTTEDGSLGEKGLVTTPLERELQNGKKARILSCGPEPMLREIAAIASRFDVPCEVALESPMACGVGSCKGCAIPSAKGGFLYVCSDGPVFDAEEIYGGGK